MARPLTQREYNPALDYQVDDLGQPSILRLWEDPSGIDVNLTVSEGDPNTAFECKNFRINRRKKLQVRNAVDYLGAAASSYVIDTATIHTSTAAEYLLRWTTVGVEYWNGSSWTALSGPALDMSASSHISWTTWNTNVLFADQRTGIYKIDLENKTYSLISGSPVCRHITTHGSRVIASHILGVSPLPTRIQWSVKDNSDDWAGTGSGFEDLLSSPSGVDTQLGVYPVNDTQAIVLRSGSLWTMDVTGYVDTPFAFKYLYPVSCDSPYTASFTPQGLYFLGRNNVYVAQIGSLQEIGNVTKDAWTNLDLTQAQGFYDYWRNEYFLYIPNANFVAPSVVWVYNAVFKAWTKFEYNFPIKSISSPNFRTTSSFDGLAGTFDSLIGTMDYMGTSFPVRGLVFVSYSPTARVLIESTTATTEPDSNGVYASFSAVIQGSRLVPQDPLDKVRLHEIQWIVENGVSTSYTPQFRYSSDAFVGSDTATYVTGTAITRSAIKKDIGAHKREIERDQIQIEMSLTGCPELVLIGVYPLITDGPRVKL